MKVIHEWENGYKHTFVYASIDEAKNSPEIVRHICDSGPSKRRVAFELGILSQELYEKAKSLPVFGDVANGCGYKDFSFITKSSLHEMYGSTFLQLHIVEGGKVIL